MLPSEDEIEQMVLSMSLQEEKIRQQQQEITELKQEVTRLKNQIRNLQHVSQPSVSSFSPVTLPSHNSLHLSRSASSGRINVRNSNVDVMHQYPNNNINNNNSSPMRRSNQLPSTPLAEQSRIVKEFEEKKQRIRSSKLSRSDNDSINSGSSSCRSSSNTNYFSGLTFFRSPQNANQISLHPLGILSPDNGSRHSTSTSSSSSTSPHYGRGCRPQPSCSIDLDRELAFQLQYETSPLEEDLENHLFSSEHNHHNDDRHQVVDPFSYLNTHPVPDLNNNNNRDLVNNTLDADENRYDVLIQLEDVKVGVKPEMMRLLRSMPFSDSYGINKDCCICFNNFSMKEMVICLPCKHQYHNHCIMKWFKDHHTCPICKTDLNESSHSR